MLKNHEIDHWSRCHKTILVSIYLLFFQSCNFSHDIKIMNVVIKWSSLPKTVNIFTPKKFYEINP